MGKKVSVDPEAVSAFNGRLAQAQMKLLDVIRTIDRCRSVTEWSDENRKKFDEMMDEAESTILKCVRAMDDTICDLREISERANNIRY